MSSDERGDKDIDYLEILREEAHRTIDNQNETLSDIDSKAARILRLNLLLLGIVLTGLSIAVNNTEQSPLSVGALANVYTSAGVVLLLLSTAAAGVTYTASNLRTGMSSRDLRNALDNDYTAKQNLEGLIDSYSKWIDYNYTKNLLNAPLGTLTILLQIWAITAFALGVKMAVDGFVESWLLGITLGFLLLLTYFTGIVGQIKRYGKRRS